MAQGTWLDDAKKNSGLLIFLGVLTVIFGIIAIATPYIVGVTVSVFVGILLLGSGVAQIVHAVKSRQWGTGIWGTVIGLLGVVAGLVMIFRPVVGLLSMTLLLAFYFLIDGISEIIAAFKIKPDQGWGWVLFNGIIAVLLGFMIWRQWPVSGAWAIGVLVGIHIVISRLDHDRSRHRCPSIGGRGRGCSGGRRRLWAGPRRRRGRRGTGRG